MVLVEVIKVIKPLEVVDFSLWRVFLFVGVFFFHFLNEVSVFVFCVGLSIEEREVTRSFYLLTTEFKWCYHLENIIPRMRVLFLKEWMFLYFLQPTVVTKPLCRVFYEELNDYILGFLGHFTFFITNRWPFNLLGQNVIIHLRTSFRVERRHGNKHFVEDYANAPPVTHFSRCFSLQNLRGNIIGRSLYAEFVFAASSFLLFSVDEGCKAKVCQF